MISVRRFAGPVTLGLMCCSRIQAEIISGREQGVFSCRDRRSRHGQIVSRHLDKISACRDAAALRTGRRLAAIPLNAAKARLAERAFPLMTAARIHERDPGGEVVGWMRRIRDMLQ